MAEPSGLAATIAAGGPAARARSAPVCASSTASPPFDEREDRGGRGEDRSGGRARVGREVVPVGEVHQGDLVAVPDDRSGPLGAERDDGGARALTAGRPPGGARPGTGEDRQRLPGLADGQVRGTPDEGDRPGGRDGLSGRCAAATELPTQGRRRGLATRGDLQRRRCQLVAVGREGEAPDARQGAGVRRCGEDGVEPGVPPDEHAARAEAVGTGVLVEPGGGQRQEQGAVERAGRFVEGLQADLAGDGLPSAAVGALRVAHRGDRRRRGQEGEHDHDGHRGLGQATGPPVEPDVLALEVVGRDAADGRGDERDRAPEAGEVEGEVRRVASPSAGRGTAAPPRSALGARAARPSTRR